jgi:hypothetical protein
MAPMVVIIDLAESEVIMLFWGIVSSINSLDLQKMYSLKGLCL